MVCHLGQLPKVLCSAVCQQEQHKYWGNSTCILLSLPYLMYTYLAGLHFNGKLTIATYFQCYSYNKAWEIFYYPLVLPEELKEASLLSAINRNVYLHSALKTRTEIINEIHTGVPDQLLSWINIFLLERKFIPLSHIQYSILQIKNPGCHGNWKKSVMTWQWCNGKCLLGNHWDFHIRNSGMNLAWK